MPEAVAVAREQDVDLSGHRSRELAQVHPASADLVVCFEWRHMAAAVVEGGADRRRTIRLIELVDALQRAAPLPKGDLTERVSNLAALAAPHREPDRSDPAFDLPDPLGGSEGLYRRTLEEISALCTRLAALILEGTPGNRT
jgi:protein-tyrosine-phosphatase